MAYHRNPYAFRVKKLFQTVILLTGICICPAGLLAVISPDQEDEAASSLSRVFRCPEQFTSNDAKQAAVGEFIQIYARLFPNNNIRDMMLFRYRLLVTHSCIQTLKSMLTDVSPASEMLRVEDRDFGPKTEEFDPETKIWTVRFAKDGEPTALSEEDLIFNFYGWKPATSPKVIANAFIRPRENLHILGRFEAPDEITKAPTYFIVSETLYPGETYGYVNISKISSVGSGAYTVTLAKKITGASASNIGEKGKAWYISAEGAALDRVVSHVGVDPGWEQYLAQAHK
jgi:hypothetical protein